MIEGKQYAGPFDTENGVSEYGDSGDMGGDGPVSQPGRCRLMVWDVSSGEYRALCVLYGRRGLAGYRIADVDHPASVYDEYCDALADVVDEGWADEVVIGDDAGNVIWRSNENREEDDGHTAGQQ